MRRGLGLLLLTTMLLMLMLTAAGCGTASRPVVAVLLADDVRLPKLEGLKAGLAEMGYPEEGLDLRVYSAAGDAALLPGLARQALAARPQVLVAGGGIEAVSLKEATAGTGSAAVPVVMMGVASSARSGLVDTFIHPGGNVTGLDNQHAELSAKRLELLTRLLPATRRVLLLYDPAVIPGRHALEVSQEAAGALGLIITPLGASTADHLLQTLRAITPGEYDAALLLPGYVMESVAPQMAIEFGRLRLPVMGPLELEGKSGLLAAYGVSMRNQGIQSARFVVKLLHGEDPATIPVETPDNPELVVDLQVARLLGLDLSPVGMALARTVQGRAGEAP